MTRRLTTLAALVAASGLAAPAHGQTSRSDPTDVQSWYGAGLQLDLPHKWEASADYRLRMIGNASHYRGSYVTGELGYAVRKHVSLFANYRFADVTEDGIAHRFGVGVDGSRKWLGTTVSFRPQVQHRLAGTDDEQGGDGDAKTVWRTRLQLKRPLTNALDVYASTEPYFDFAASYPVDNWRNTLGMKYEYAPGKKLDLFYIYRPDYAKSYNRTFHVVGMSLDFDAKLGRGRR